MPIERISHCSDEPEAIDEIVASGATVHIERMSDGHYWMQIDGVAFDLSTKKRGRLIITKQ